MSETPFKISIPDEKIALLRQKLELTTFPDELEDSGWEYVANKLTLALGYTEYDYLQDRTNLWGETQQGIAHKHVNVWPQRAAISCLTFFLSGEAPKLTTEPSLTEKEKAGLERTSWFHRLGGGYLRQQSTQPQTLGYSLSDFLSAFSVPEPRLSQFPKDILVYPKNWTREMGNVVFDANHESGGHFAAYERPEYLADDLRKMFGKGGPALDVVSGHSGYT
ncbi:hypothetical protein C8F04DRAFT_1230776 [Mycena alexandri]|uniref:Epoxide hydrolase n=1 Tax=Mycena alexandri TaxID=1745969 RepID=A0AAD6T6I0_9AGAR|nr:hypothetical protein C8F04DRAFT_1230776 [Mycena alexandri]